MLEISLPKIISHLRPDRVIGVDRASLDQTVEMASGCHCTVVTDTTSLGSARMRGVRESQADWIAFIDDDIVLPSGFRVAMERIMTQDIGAIQAAAIWVHEPYRQIHMDEFSSRMGRSDHFDYLPGERGFTNATLIRRCLLEGLDLTEVNSWEDWIITQRVLSLGYRWVVTKPFVEHIHDFGDLAKKEGWNAAGILNLGRTGHMPVTTSLRHYFGKIALAVKGAVKYTILMKDPSQFFQYLLFIANILMAPRHLFTVVPRMPRPIEPLAMMERERGRHPED